MVHQGVGGKRSFPLSRDDLGRYLAILRSWRHVEVHLMRTYGADAKTVLTEWSWRQLRNVIDEDFEINSTDSAGNFDWRSALDQATGRESGQVTNMSLEDYMKKVGR